MPPTLPPPTSLRSPRMNPAVFPPRDILMELPTFEAFFQQPRLGVDLVGELDDTRIRESINMILSQQRRERMEGAGGEGEGEGDGDDVPLYLGVVLPHAGTDDAGEWMRAAVEVRGWVGLVRGGYERGRGYEDPSHSPVANDCSLKFSNRVRVICAGAGGEGEAQRGGRGGRGGGRDGGKGREGKTGEG